MTLLQTASPNFWGEAIKIGSILAGNLVVTGVIVRAIADNQLMKGFDRCQDRIVYRLDTWFKTRHERVDALEVTVSKHEDQMTAFEAAQERQGIAIRDQLSEQGHRTTVALEAITKTLSAIQVEAQSTAVMVAVINERTSGRQNSHRSTP